jgi:hypothetical protein
MHYVLRLYVFQFYFLNVIHFCRLGGDPRWQTEGLAIILRLKKFFMEFFIMFYYI